MPAEVEPTTVAHALREPFLAKMLLHVERWIDRYVAIGLPRIIPAWHERMAPNLAARAVVGDTTITGEVAGLDSDGALLLRDASAHLHRVALGQRRDAPLVVTPGRAAVPWPFLPPAAEEQRVARMTGRDMLA